MGGHAAELPTDVQELHRLVINLQKENELLHDELSLLRHKIFGRHSERFTPEDILQSSLFDEPEQAAPGTEGSVEVIEVAAHQRGKRGRRALPSDLPREEVVHDIPEEQKWCSCGAALQRMGEETCEKLEIIPQQLKVIRHIRPKYVCKKCNGGRGRCCH